MKIFKSPLLVGAAFLLCLTSCFSSAGSKNTVVYTPRASSPTTNASPAVSWQIRIDAPKSSDFLDSTHIAVRRADNTLQVFGAARWSDSVPDLLQSNLTLTFNDSGKINAVTGLDSNTVSDAILLLDIRQFEAVYEQGDDSAAAVISVQANIQLQKTNRIIASKHFLVSVPSTNKKIPQVMTAFDAALQQVSQDILNWTLTANVPTKN
ncbi:MAG: ABC-type transport auxiliary lipoprotein family protein [Arenimonas sp.]